MGSLHQKCGSATWTKQRKENQDFTEESGLLICAWALSHTKSCRKEPHLRDVSAHNLRRTDPIQLEPPVRYVGSTWSLLIEVWVIKNGPKYERPAEIFFQQLILKKEMIYQKKDKSAQIQGGPKNGTNFYWSHKQLRV